MNFLRYSLFSAMTASRRNAYGFYMNSVRVGIQNQIINLSKVNKYMQLKSFSESYCMLSLRLNFTHFFIKK